MIVMEDISGIVKKLLEQYEFNPNTLAGYTGLTAEQIHDVANGNMKCISGKHTIADKIMFLYAITCEDADLKASAFLEVLISYHHLSEAAIAKMADVEVGDIDRMLDGLADKVDTETKYRITAAVMSLRFFLKDCEPPLEE